jgi:7-cyano-7-deazaguanine tRNA-ribosyltransferase
LGRIGILETKSGKLETPALLPVVNPLAQEIPPRVMFERFGCKGLITNSYLIRRRAAVTGTFDIHDFLDFPGVVATDSGAYQILRYGGVEVSSREIIEYQQSIETDIGVILDIPTGSKASRTHAAETVNETIRRADEAQRMITRRDIAWVGPIQGGQYADLIARCAHEMSARGFDIYALGSPTEIMEQYLFADLVNMIFAAKTHLPSNAPFHLFGAGHPFMLALAVALGCDLFDSAAYILYARRNRYLTSAGTLNLREMNYFPCRCTVCAGTSPGEVRSRPAVERTQFLAEHNLLACLQEIETIKEAIEGGRLWELVEVRCRSHPRLLEALLETRRYRSYMSRGAPSTKRKGILFFDSISLQRPEYVTHLERLLGNYAPPKAARIALLVPATQARSNELNARNSGLAKLNHVVHVCLYSPPYGLVPSELEYTFPFSQTESLEVPDPETLTSMAETVQEYLAKHTNYQTLVVIRSSKEWQIRFAKKCERFCKRIGVRYSCYVEEITSRGLTGILNREKRHLTGFVKRRTLQKRRLELTGVGSKKIAGKAARLRHKSGATNVLPWKPENR